MWYLILALLMGLGAPSAKKGGSDHPTVQSKGGGNSGDTGQTPPPPVGGPK